MAGQVKFADRASADAAIKEIRNDSSEKDWVLFGYDATQKNMIVFQASGSGGLSALVDALRDDAISYGLLRVTDVIDGHTTTKFVYIVWVGEGVKGLNRARITPHKGDVTRFIGQHHVEIYAERKDELPESRIMEKVTDASGSGSRVLDESKARPATAGASAQRSGGSQIRSAPSGSNALVFEDEGAIKAAIADLRNDATPTDWVLVGYQGTVNTISLIGSGSEGVEQLKGLLKDDEMSYGLVRVTDVIDGHNTTKFVFIEWVGESVPITKKARVTTHKGQITKLLGQYHTDLAVTQLSELTIEEVMNKVQFASGTKSNVKETSYSSSGAAPQHRPVAQPAPTPAPAATTAHSGSSSPRGATAGPAGGSTNSAGASKRASSYGVGVPKTGAANITFVDIEASKAAIAAVRANNDPADWVLLGYQGSTNNVVLVGSGSGGVDELRSNLREDAIAYGLVRVTDVVDGHNTTKFVFIIWVGERVPIIRKARITTHKGDITTFFGQYHTDLNPSTHDEVTYEAIMNKVQFASGTKSNVK